MHHFLSVVKEMKGYFESQDTAQREINIYFQTEVKVHSLELMKHSL